MKLKKVLIILGHPLKDSLNGGLAEQYAEGARAGGHEVKTLFLGEMDFNPMLEKGYKEIQPLEPDLERAQELIKWADHVVLIYPTWWPIISKKILGSGNNTSRAKACVFFPPWIPSPSTSGGGCTIRVIISLKEPWVLAE
jgi:hypothetical protein